ncbi:MAG TPA: hypothetical protein VER11_11625, partial [Polyangiaceae bacterium]|nr:hypothetical protein [Polyangiaceae bacterium]
CTSQATAGASAGGTSGAGASGAGTSGASLGGARSGSGGESVGEAGAGGENQAGAGGDGAVTPGTATDFPEQPILVDGVPANAPELFAAAKDTSTNPLCVLEPQLSAGTVPGAMFPSNWLRPRFRVAAVNFDLYEIRLQSAAERNELVVYTRQKTWYLPKAIWRGQGSKAGLSAAAAGDAIRVTIRALDTSAPLLAARVSGTFNVAPAVASGSILFPAQSTWSLQPDSSQVHAFSVGDEGVQTALTLQQLSWSGQFVEDGSYFNGYYDDPKLAGFADGNVRRINRPALTPESQALAFSDETPYALGIAQLTGSVGSVPLYMGKGALALLRLPWLGNAAFSAGHWAANDRIVVSSYGTTFKSGKSRTVPWQNLPTYEPPDWFKWHQLVWFDLESSFTVDLVSQGYGPTLDARNAPVAAAKGSSWGLISTGDSGLSDVSPSFNPAGDTLAYVATDYSPTGRPDATATKADVRLVAYNSRAGGVSQALAGASDANDFEYEPTFSPDGKLIAFSRAASGGPDGPYRNRYAEVSVVPAIGGQRTRLLANDPNSCANDPTPLALLNGSPAWGPNPIHRDGHTYYFLLFTSARKYGDEFATQFQLSGTDDSNTLRSSTQLYLTTVVVDDATGSITSYPAVYVWNQNRFPTSGSFVVSYSNMTPVWGTTVLPAQSIPPVP